VKLKVGKSITGDRVRGEFYLYCSTNYWCVMLFGRYIELRTQQSEVEK